MITVTTFRVGNLLITSQRCKSGAWLHDLWAIECREYHALPQAERTRDGACDPMRHAAFTYFHSHKQACNVCRIVSIEVCASIADAVIMDSSN